MGLTESGRFEVYTKKLKGLCDEHNLVYRFIKDSYPIMLILKTTGEIDGQMSMLEEAEDDGYRSPDAKLIFSYKDGDLVYRISETFTIGDALFNKLKNLFKNMHSLWLQYFFRDIVERKALPEKELPVIEDEGESGDIVSATFDEVKNDLKPLESFDDDEAADGEENGYEYDDPSDADPDANPDDEA